MASTSQPAVAQGDDAGSLRALVSYAAMTGLCPLVPLPILDDWLRDLLRRRQVARLAADHGLRLSDEQVDVLACGHRPVTASGCAVGCLQKLVVTPVRFVVAKILRKLVRKILVVLMVKDCVDVFSATFHEAYLLRHAFARGVPEPGASFDDVVTLRRRVEAVRDEVDHRPVERTARRVFRSSRRLLSATARAVAAALRGLSPVGRRDEDEVFDQVARESSGLGGVVDELTAEIGHQGNYLRRLRTLLDARLGVDIT